MSRTPTSVTPVSLVRRQLTAGLLRSRVFALLLWLLCALTPFMYFFVRFSIDANRRALLAGPSLSDQQKLLVVAMDSNAILARNFLWALTLLTGLVFAMFFYRYFRRERSQLGCLKSLGFRDRLLRGHFARFTAVMSVTGAFAGLMGGYFCSSVLIAASERSYQVSGLVKGIGLPSLAAGILGPCAAFCLVAFVSYGQIRRRETWELLRAPVSERFSGLLKFADRCTRRLPQGDPYPLRIALRKPVSLALMLAAVMGFSVMFILAYSLTISSGKVHAAQTQGRGYEYDTRYDDIRLGELEGQRYLELPGAVAKAGGATVSQRVVGIAETGPLLELRDNKGGALAPPEAGAVYVGPWMREVYDIREGDKISITIEDKTMMRTVTRIAANAETNCLYLNREELAAALALPAGAFNGALSLEPVSSPGGSAQTRAQRLEELDRASVSNRMSAVINQATGCAVGLILMYLALLLNFQDSTREIVILHMVGYRPKAIKKMLVDIYRPILWLFYLLALWPGIAIVQSIQRSLSIQTRDYMPFGTNLPVILGVFVLLNLVYHLVQASFGYGIRRIVQNEAFAEHTAAD